MGDRLGIAGVVGFLLFFFLLMLYIIIVLQILSSTYVQKLVLRFRTTEEWFEPAWDKCAEN